MPVWRASTYLDALTAALFAGRLASPGEAPGRCHRQRAPRRGRRTPRGRPICSWTGLPRTSPRGTRRQLPILRRALSAFDRETSAEVELRWLWLGCVAASHLWDYDRWDRFSRRHLKLTREAGAFSELPGALGMRAHVLFFAGELAAAASLVEEVQVAAEATGMRLAPYGALGLAAFRGREAETAALASAAKEEVAVRGEGNGIGIADWATALLSNGLGRHDRALAAAEQASAYPAEVSTANWGLVELIEAAARAGSPERGDRRDAAARGVRPAPAAPTGRSGWKRGHGPC